MDELEQRNLIGRFLSSKRNNATAVLDYYYSYVTGKFTRMSFII